MTDRHPGLKKALYGAKNRIRIYPGQYEDQETGLHYNWWRYYGSEVGRYLKPDPSHSIDFDKSSVPYSILYELFTPLRLNNAIYSSNNAVNLIDAWGLLGCKPYEDPQPEEDEAPDCRKMRLQEKASKSPFGRRRNCLTAYKTCKQNCDLAKANEKLDGTEQFDLRECYKGCDAGAKKCNKGKGFKFPQSLYDHLGCGDNKQNK